MSLFKNLNSFLNKPFPGPDSIWTEVKGMLIAALIVFIFLYLFKPFGMSSYQGSVLALTLKFGLVSLVASLFYFVLTTFILKIHKDLESWTMKRWIIDMLLMILCIAVANYIFVLYHYKVSFSLDGLANMLLSTLMVAVFPVVFFGYKKQLRLERANAKSAQSFSNHIDHPQKATNSDATFILAVESMQNYVHVYSVVNGMLKKETVRMTLASALDEYKNQGLMKCHRSFLVNPSHIQKVQGNAQGLKLTLSHEDGPLVPVSRTYISSIKSAL